MTSVPGLRLKERVREGSMTARDALNTLRETDRSPNQINLRPDQNATVRWLLWKIEEERS